MKEAIKLVEKALEILKSEEKKEKVVLSSLKPGETFMIGEHEFIVLEQNYETTNVISKNLMAENVRFDGDTRDYNKSALKKYIDEKIKPIILENVGAGEGSGGRGARGLPGVQQCGRGGGIGKRSAGVADAAGGDGRKEFKGADAGG